jgi:hypothetical protein
VAGERKKESKDEELLAYIACTDAAFVHRTGNCASIAGSLLPGVLRGVRFREAGSLVGKKSGVRLVGLREPGIACLGKPDG